LKYTVSWTHQPTDVAENKFELNNQVSCRSVLFFFLPLESQVIKSLWGSSINGVWS